MRPLSRTQLLVAKTLAFVTCCIFTPCFAEAPAKAEPSQDIQAAALAALPPTERLLADVQAAFEAAEVPMSDYTSLDAAGLAWLLPPPVVARSARLFLEEKMAQWSCRRVLVVLLVCLLEELCVPSFFYVLPIPRDDPPAFVGGDFASAGVVSNHLEGDMLPSISTKACFEV